MSTLSFWEQQTFFHTADIVIIGSGIVGLNAAIALKKMDSSLKVTVIERGPLPFGASTKNAGFACFGSMTEILDDLETSSKDVVFSLVEKRWQGLQKLRTMLGDRAIQYQPFGGYEIFKENEEKQFEKCLEQMPEFNQALADITGHENVYTVASNKTAEFGFRNTSQLIFNQLEGQLNTGEMMKKLIHLATEQGIQLINGLDIEFLNENENQVDIVAGNGWKFSARKVLVATNGFARHFFPDIELWPARNQVLITKPVDKLPFKGSFHYDKGYVYFRNVDVACPPSQSRILLGGSRNLDLQAENTAEFGTTELIQNALLKLLREVILPDKKVEVESWWSGIMGLGKTKKPLIEMRSPRIGIAVRLGGMGVALGSLAGEEAAGMIFQK